MKKYIISVLIIGSFGTYILFQKIGGNSSVLPVASNVSTQSQTVAITDVAPSPTTQTVPAQKTSPAKTPVATAPVPAPAPAIVPKKTGQYVDGTYTGSNADAYYGNVQVKAIVQGGKLTDVQILSYPNDRGNSIRINNRAMPILVSEAISAQSANVNAVSGATDSSGAFKQSLSSALSQAI